MFFLSLRNVMIRNATGTHDQRVRANTPTFVAVPLHDAAHAAGCVPCDEKGVVIQPDAPEARPPVVQPPVAAAPTDGLQADPAPAPESPAPAEEVVGYTEADLVSVMTDLVAANEKDNFSPNGRPKVAAVAKLLGHKPTLGEVEAAWASMKDVV